MFLYADFHTFFLKFELKLDITIEAFVILYFKIIVQ